MKKIILEVPDGTSCIGIFLNKQEENKTITTTNWLTGAEDGKIIRVDEACKITEWRSEDGVQIR